MPDEPSRRRRLVLLRRVLLGFAVLVSAAATAVFGFAIYLFVGGYSGGSNPESISALAFPLSFLVVIFVGLPAALICALAWAVHFVVARRSRR